MRCLIDKSSIEPFHVFPRKAIFNKPLNHARPDAVAAMEIGYNPLTRHISSHLKTKLDVDRVTREVYQELYGGYAPTGLSPTQKAYTDFVARWIDANVPARSRVLEVGSHDGFLLHALKEAGHEVQGVEPSPFADKARDDYGISVIHGFFTGNEFPPATFDVLVMRHVVEHVADPVAFLQAGAKLLKPGGLAYVEVPNSQWSLEEFFFPEFHIDHISYFTPASLERLMHLCGFSALKHKEAYTAYMRFPFQCALGVKAGGGWGAVEVSAFSDFNVPRAIERFGKVHARYLANLHALRTRGSIAVWGTGSIGHQYAIDAGWGLDGVTYIDVNPTNQGKVLSVTGHKVENPEILRRLKPDVLLIASGWEGDVREQARPYLSDKTQVLVFRDLL